MSNKLNWLAVGQTVTQARLKDAADVLPDEAMAELWVGRTINREALAKIEAAGKKKPAKKQEGGE